MACPEITGRNRSKTGKRCNLALRVRTRMPEPRRSRVPGAAQHLKGVYARLRRAMHARDRAYGSTSLRAAPRPGHAIASDAFGTVFTFQTAHLVPAAHVLRPGSATLLHSPRIEGVGGAPRNVRVPGGTLVGRIMCVKDARERAHDAIRQALARRLASHNAGRSPLGAPPWRFFTRGRASVSGMIRIRRARSSQPGRSAWRAASRASRD